MHEVRCVLAQPLAFVQRLVDQPHLALLQVAQAAVHELRALRRRARGEVVALDERRAQPTRRGVEGDADAGDASADHDDVEGLVAQSTQHVASIEGANLRRRAMGHAGHPRSDQRLGRTCWRSNLHDVANQALDANNVSACDIPPN